MINTDFYFILAPQDAVRLLTLTIGFSYSDSVEREETLGDNNVQLQSFVQYEPDLFVSRYACTIYIYLSFSLQFFVFSCVFTCFFLVLQ